MNLRNNTITIGEVLKNPAAWSLLQREYPQFANHPMLRMVQMMPLQAAVNQARGFLTQKQINHLISELEKI